MDKQTVLRMAHLRKAIGFRSGLEFYRFCEPSIGYREALAAVKAVKHMRLTAEEVENGKLLWHLCQGYNVAIDIKPHWDCRDWKLAAKVLYREWPENTSRVSWLEAATLLYKFGFENPRVIIAKLDALQIVVWEQIADLNQIGLNPRLMSLNAIAVGKVEFP